MSKRTLWMCVLLVGLYTLGLISGGVFQANIREQTEMHQYLTKGVSDYGEGILDGTKAVFYDGIFEVLVLFVSAYLPFGIYAVGGALAVRGFMTGFAQTAMLRTYGIAGAVLCAGNILSATVTAPCLVGYGLFIQANQERVGRVKLGIFSFVFLLMVLCADCILKGGLTSVIMRLWR